ncbi:MAG: VTT domain-containing protein [Chryseolinea sp.]
MVKAKTEKTETSKNKLFFYAPLVVIAALVASYFIFPSFQDGVNEAFDVITSDDNEKISNWVRQFGVFGPIVLILTMTVQMFMFVIPNILLFIISIICYGPVLGSLICLVGVFTSSTLGYFVGSKLGSKAMNRFVSEKVQEKIAKFVKRYGFKAIAIARLSSLISDGLGFAAGILGMNYRKFIFATMAGITPVIILIAIYGRNGKIERALIWIAGISLVLLVLYILIDKRRQNKHA